MGPLSVNVDRNSPTGSPIIVMRTLRGDVTRANSAEPLSPHTPNPTGSPIMVMRTLRGDVRRGTSAEPFSPHAQITSGNTSLDANTQVLASVVQMMAQMDARLQRIEAGNHSALERLERLEADRQPQATDEVQPS